MREQRANLIAAIAAAAALAGAVSAALMTLSHGFGPVSWPSADARAVNAPPIRLPDLGLRATQPPSAPGIIRRARGQDSPPRQRVSTIISALPVSVPSARAVSSATEPSAIRRVTIPPRRTPARPHMRQRLVVEKRGVTSVALPSQPVTATSAPTASAAAADAPSTSGDKKAAHRLRKDMRKQLDKLDGRPRSARGHG